jgi:hypothetical protein
VVLHKQEGIEVVDCIEVEEDNEAEKSIEVEDCIEIEEDIDNSVVVEYYKEIDIHQSDNYNLAYLEAFI